MSVLEEIRPTERRHVFDLVEEAGFDVTDWVTSSKNARGPKANPKYCYEWSFEQPGKLIVLNLWHDAMREVSGKIVHRHNYRADVERHRVTTRKAAWENRARRVDEAIQAAVRGNLPIRVIINDGQHRGPDNPELRPSQVRARQLDPEPWMVSDYDQETGDCELTRGIISQRYVDQFDIEASQEAALRRSRTAINAFIRDAAVRRRVLIRANGQCELCGKPGFEMPGGAVYLETHHVLPLACGGADHDDNVAALCADDHRRAHFGVERDQIASKLIAILSGKKIKRQPPNAGEENCRRSGVG